MKTLFLDTETTGLPLWKEPSDHPEQPHIVDIACDLFDGDQVVDQYDALINIGVPIPPEMTEIHGISDEMVQADGVAPNEALERFMGMVRQADIICGHNVSFDIRMVRIMAARLTGEKWENPLPVFCTMRKSTNLVRVLSEKARHPEDWKWPKLSEAYQHFFGEELAEAHRARPDMEASRRIFFHLKSLEN